MTTTRAMSGRRLATVAVVVLLVLLVAELGARALDARLPDPMVWHTEAAQAKVHQMDALGEADVVAVGSSLVAYGIDPSILEERLAGRVGTDPVAYNAGLTAGLPELTQPWTSRVVLPRLDPRVLVVGVGSFDFTDHRSGEVFRDAFLDSPAGRRVTRTDDPLGDASWWLADHSALWANRSVLRQPRTLVAAVRGDAPAVDPDVAALQPDGRTTRYESTVFDPDGPRGPGLPVGGWTLGTRQPAALRTLVEEALARGTEVVLVAMPTTDAFVARHPHGEQDHDTYLRTARQLADGLSVPFLAFDDLRTPELFLDEVHLNRDGATEFTRQLADALAALDLSWQDRDENPTD